MSTPASAPQKAPRFSARFLKRLSSWLVLSTALTVSIPKKSPAADLTWDPAGNLSHSGGAGVWSTNPLNLFWDSAGTDVAWSNAANLNDTAIFTGTGGQVDLGSGISVGTLQFDASGYTITGGSGPFALTLNGGILANESATVSAGIILGATNTWNVGSTKTLTVSGVVSGSGLGIAKTGAGTLLLSNTNTFTGGLTIKAGTVKGTTSANAFGANSSLITLGDSTGSASVTLESGFAGTIANAISVASGNSGVATITASAATTFSGPVTLNSHDLTISAGASNMAFSGGFTGTGNLTLSSAGAGVITLSTTSVNHSGTITNSGSGAATNLITTSVGSNVTGITQNSTTSALTASGGLIVNSGGTTLTNSAGTKVLTVSGAISGTGDLILKNNSATNDAIAVSGTTLGIVGSLINSGTGAGRVSVSNQVTSAVTQVVQNSATSALLLSNGTNAFGSLLIKSGTARGVQNTAGQLTSLGGGTVFLGDTGGSASAALEGNGTQSTFANPIVLGTTSGTLTIACVNSATAMTVSGGVTGAHDLLVNNNANTAALNFTTGALNNAGTISNVTPAGGSGGVVIGSAIGSNVTGLIQNSTTSATTVNGQLTVNSTATTFTNSAGTKILTVAGGVVGTGDLILRNNSALAGGVAVTTASVNNIGTVTNSGTGAGAVTISGGVGSNVTLIHQNSTTSALNVTTTALTVNAGGTTLKNTAGTSLLTVSGAVGGTGDLILQNNSATAGGITVSTNPVNMTGAILNNGTGNGSVVVSSIIGTSVTGVTQNSATSTLSLGAQNTFNSNVTILKGTLTSTFNFTPFGSGVGTILLGDTTAANTNAATLSYSGTSTTVSNPITVQAGSSGTLSILGLTNTNTFTGAITLNNNLTVDNNTTAKITTFTGGVTASASALAISKLAGLGAVTFSTTGLTVGAGGMTLNSAGGGLLTFSAGVSGTGNLVLNNNGATAAGITLSTTPVNISGTITNSGTGAGDSTISGGVGANVTAINQSSTTSALNIITTALTVNSGGTTLTNTAGTKLLTVSGGIGGTGDLILQNNNATANGITISGTAVNHTGVITSNGTGVGITLISAPIGGNVTAINANSNTSPLSLTGAITLAGGDDLTISSNGSTTTIVGAAAMTGTGNVIFNANNTGAFTVSATSPTGIAGTITNSGTGSGTTTYSGVIGTSVLGVIQNSATSTLSLTTVANTFTSNLTILKGTVTGSFATTPFGAGTILLGDTTAANTNAATLSYSGTGTTVANPITVRAGSSGTLSILGLTNINTFTGAITLNNNLTVDNNTSAKTTTFTGGVTASASALAISKLAGAGAVTFSTTGLTIGVGGMTLNSAGGGLLTVSAAVSGTGNLVLNNNGATAAGITISGAVNTNGLITVSGTGAGGVTISGGISSGVTAINQNSTTSALSVTTAALTVNGSGTTLINTAGGGILTISGGITGTGDLVLQNNSATASGISITTTAVGHTGLITNNGNGTGSSLISAVIGTSVTGVIQDSATSPLVLGGANTFTSGLTIKNGAAVANVSNVSTTSGAAGPSTVAIALGDSTGSNSASMLANNGITVSNPINLGATAGTLSIGNNGGTTAATFTGNITLNGHDLTVTTTGTTGSTTYSTGSISGTANLILNALTTSAGTAITISAGVGHTGNIINSGTGVGTALISGAIASTVVNVTQNSATSTLTLGSAANAYTGVTTILAGTLSITGQANFDGTAVSGPLGATSNAATSLVLDGGTFSYGGPAVGSTDRLFTVTANGGAVAHAGAGTLGFTNTTAITASGTGDRTLTLLANSSSGSFTFSPLIVDPSSGTTALNINGTGTSPIILLPVSANPFTGGITITGRTLQIQSGLAIGTNAITFGNGTSPTLDLRNNAGTNFTTSGGGNLIFGNNTGTVSLSAVSASNGSTHTVGTITIGNGNMTIAHGSNLNTNTVDSLQTGAVILTGNPTFTVNNGNGTAVGLTTLGALNDGGVARTVTVAGGAGGGARLVFAVAPSQFTPGTNLVINTNALGAVRLTVANGFSDGTAADAIISFGALGTGTLQLLNNSSTIFNNNLSFGNNSGTIAVGPLTAGQGTAVTHTMGTVTIGTATLSSTSTNGATNIASSLILGATTLTGNSTFSVGTFGTGIVNLTLGALDDGGTARTLAKTGGGNLILGTAATSIVAGTVLNESGAGSVTLANANAFGSGSINASGTSQVVLNATTNFTTNITTSAAGISGQGNLKGPTSGGNLTATYSGTYTVNAQPSAGGMIEGGTGAGASLIMANSIVLGPAVTSFVQRAGTVTYNSPFTFSGANNLTQFNLSIGQTILGGNNIFPATTNLILANVGNGTFALGAFNQTVNNITLGGAGAFVTTISSGTGVLTLNGTLANDAGSTGTQLITGNLDLGGGTRTFNIDTGAAGSDVTISGVVSGGSMSKTGLGILTLSGANTYGGTGNTFVVNGTVVLAANFSATSIGTVNLGGSTGTNSVTLNQTLARNVASPITVTANATAGALLIGGTNAVGTTAYYSGVVTVNNNVTLNSTTAGAITNFNGSVSSGVANAITISGAGTVVFGGNNTGLLGTVTAPSGTTVEFASGATAPTGSILLNGLLLNSGALVFNYNAASNGAELITANDSLNRNFTASPNLSLGSYGAYTYSGTMTPGVNGYLFGGGSGILTVSSQLTGATALTINANSLTGNVSLTNGANDYSGQTTVNSGVLTFVIGALGVGNTAAVVVGSATGSATLQWAASNTTDLSSRLTLVDGGTAILDTNGNTINFANAIGNNLSATPSTGNLTKIGAGSLTLAAPAVYTGTTTLTNGTLSSTAGGAGVLPLGTGNVVIAAGTLSFVPAFSAGNTDLSLASASGKSLSFGDSSQGGGATLLLTANGANNLTVTAGALTRNSLRSSLIIAATSVLSTTPTLGASERFYANGEVNTVAGEIYNPYVIAQDNSGVSGAAVGSFVTYNATVGFQALEAVGSLTSYTPYNSGSVTFGSTEIVDVSGAVSAGAGSVKGIRVGGTTLTLTGTLTLPVTAGIILNPTATASKITGSTLGTTATTELDIYVGGGSGNATIDNLGALTGTLIKSGPGQLIFGSGAAVGTGFTGTIIVNGGTFRGGATSGSSTGIRAAVIIANAGATYIAPGYANHTSDSTVYVANAGGTINLGGSGDTAGGFQGSGTVTASGGTNTWGSFSGRIFSGVLAGAGAHTFDGSANSNTFTLSGTLPNTNSGTVTVIQGVLALSKTPNVNAIGGNLTINAATAAESATAFIAGDNQIPNTATVTVKGFAGATSTFDLRNFNETIGALSDGGGTASASFVTLGSGQLTLTASSGTATYAGTISGTGGSIVKTGASTAIFGGANTYTSGNTIGTANGATGGILQATGAGGALGIGGALTIYAGTVDLTTTTQSISTLSLGGGASGTTAVLNLGAGSILNLGGNVTYNAANNPNGATITGSSGTINLNGSRTFTVGSSSGSGGLDLSIASAIANGTGGASGLTKDGAGYLLLGGANTYTGGTTLNLGNLQVTGSLAANTALSIAGNTGFSLLSGAANPLGSISTLQIGAGASTVAIGLDLGADTASSDYLSSPNAATTAGTFAFYLNGITGFGTSLTYDLITAASGLSAATYIVNGAAPGGYTYSFASSTDSVVRLSLTPVSGNIYWRGGISNSWTGFNAGSSNFTTDLAGTSNAHAAPGVGSNVIFSATGATGPTLTTTLDEDFSIKDLTFNSNVPSITAITIASGTGTHTLTITPDANTAGINVATGAAASIGISVGVILGADQTWTVADAATTLSVTGNISGTGNLTKAGNGLLAISGTSSYVGATTVNGGVLRFDSATAVNAASAYTIGAAGTLRLNAQNTSLVSLTGAAGAIVENGAASGNVVLTVGSNNASTTYAGVLQNGAAATLGLTKVGNGTLNLSGASTYTGGTTLTAGVLNLTGSLTGNGTTTTGPVLAMTGNGTTNAVINVSGNITNYYTFTGANVAGANVAYNQTGGTVNFTTTAVANATNILATTGYASMNITGGTLVAKGRFMQTNGPASTSVIYIGGTGTLDTSAGEWFLMTYSSLSGGNGGLAEITVGPGGSLLHAGASQLFGLNVDRANGYAVLNIAGGLFTTSTKNITFGNSATAVNNTTGILNLAAGTLTLGMPILSGNTLGTGNLAYLNFAGGTIQANAAVTAVIPATAANETFTSTIFGAIDNSSIAGAPSFTGGLKVDTNGNAVSFTNPFLAATGSGVFAANVSVTGGSGYIGAPVVQFTGGTLAPGGTPASGYAVISGGVVTGIVITSPGTYSVAPNIVLTGGGGTGASASVTSLAANTSAGLTKLGTGALTMSNAGSTYTGGNTVGTANGANAGTLRVGVAQGLGVSAPMTIYGGTLDLQTFTQSVTSLTLGGGASGSSANVTIGAAGVLELGGNVTFSAANNPNPATISGAGTLNLNADRVLTVAPSTSGSNQLLAVPDLNVSAIVADGAGGAHSITLSGNGRLSLSNAANTFSGAIVINAGTGQLDLGSSGLTSSITVAGGTSSATAPTLFLTTQNPVSGTAYTTGTLALGNFSNLTFALGASANAANPILTVNTITLPDAAHPVNINLTKGGAFDVAASTVTYTLISSTSTDLTGSANSNFILGNSPGGYLFSLSDTATTLKVDAVQFFGPLYWKGNFGSGDTTWSTTAPASAIQSNWTSDAAGTTTVAAVPGINNDVIFSATGAINNAASVVDTAMAVKTLTVNDALATTIVGGSSSSLTLGGTGVVLNVANGAGGLVLGSTNAAQNLPIILGSATPTFTNASTGLLDIKNSITATTGATVLTINGTGNVAIGGVISNGTATSLSLLKTTATTLTLSGLGATTAANYSGSTSVDRGTLVIVGNAALAGALNFGSAKTITTPVALDLSNGSATFGSFLDQINNATTASSIVIGSGQTMRINGAVNLGSDTGGSPTTKLNVTGLGIFTVGALGAPTNASITLGLNATTQFSNGVTWDMSGLATFYANLGSGTFRIGDAANAGGQATLGSTLILAANSTITAASLTQDSPDGAGVTQTIKLGSGTNTINASTIFIGASAGAGRTNGVLQFNGATGSLVIRDSATTGRSAITVVSGGTTTGGSFTGLVDLTSHTADLLISTLSIASRSATSGAGSATGSFLFDTGTLNATSINMAARSASSATTAAMDATLGLMVAPGTTGSVTIGTLTMAANSSTSATSSGGATATLNIGGSGTVGITTMTMSNNTVAGGATAQTTNPSKSTVNISGSTTAIGTLTMNVNSSANTGTGNASVATLNVSNGTVNVGAGGIVMATVSNAAATANSTIAISGGAVTTGAAGINMANASVAGAKANSIISITGGSLTMGGNLSYTNGAGTENTTLNLDGGTLDMGGFNIGASGTLVGSGTGTLTFASGTLRDLGELNNGADLNKTTTGTLVLQGTNSYNGATNITQGVVSARSDTALGSTAGATTVTSGAALEIQSNAHIGTETINLNGSGISSTGALRSVSGNNSLGGTVNLATASSVGVEAGSELILSGSLSGSVPMTKVGSGTLTLAGDSSAFTGSTLVSVGTLNTGTSATPGNLSGSTVTVATGATISGNGTLGALIAQSGATVAPGNSAGILTTSTFDLQSGAHLQLELGSTTAGGPTGFDQIRSTGVSLAGDVQVTLALGFTETIGATYAIILNSGSFAGTFSNGSTVSTGDGHIFNINYGVDFDSVGGANDVTLTLVTVPEPNALAMLVGSLGMALSLQRFRRRRA